MNKKSLVAIVLAFVATIGGFLYYIYTQNQTINTLSEAFALEKEDLENEYSQLAIQYEGYRTTINNDSLEQKLEDQRIKIQRLVEELKQTKAQDAKKIASLKKELETVRGVLRHYVAQVDSLNRVNEMLVEENTQVKKEIQQVKNSNANLQSQNQKLTDKVTLAAKLQAVGIRVNAYDKKDQPLKKVKNLEKVNKLGIAFSIASNITTEAGYKDIYIRILNPAEDVLGTNANKTFKYDGADVLYTEMKSIEYGGEETAVEIFWKKNAVLDWGKYIIEIYADGNMIGRATTDVLSKK